MTVRNDLSQRRKHRLPAAVYAATGHEFHFTVCARNQSKPFDNPKIAHDVIDSLMWTRQRYGWVLFCYCLMPDHLHFVCRLTDEDVRILNTGARGEQPEGVLDHLARFKSYTTQRAWKHGIEGQLWQQSSYDRAMDMQKPFEQVVQYVLDNPVRKGLATDWEEWPYSAIVDLWQ